MIKAIKEIFITFIALYMLVISSGVFNAVNFIFAEKAFNEVPTCNIGSSDKPCTCSCNMEFAGECCCCSVEDTTHQSQPNHSRIIFTNNCNNLPTLHSDFVVLKFVVSGRNIHTLFPYYKKYVSIKYIYDQHFRPSIDHPPSTSLS